MVRWYVVVLALAMGGAPASASTGLSGMPPFSLTGEVLTLPTPERAGVLRIITRGRYSKNQTALVKIHLPPGLTATRGDLVRTVHPDGDSPDADWDIEIQPRVNGLFEISGTLTVDVGDGYGRDETDFRTELYVGPDTTWATHGRGVRYERVTGTQRYRYGGAYLVPISRSEQVTPDDIISRAKVVQKKAATCKGCQLDAASSSVNLLVFLDENGHATDVRALPKELPSGQIAYPDSAVFSSAKEALTGWVFSPSKTKSRSVADFITVSVEVLSEK